MANKKTRVPMTQRTWEWYKQEIARLQKVDKEITDRVRATYSVKEEEIEVPCSLEQDLEWARESENII